MLWSTLYFQHHYSRLQCHMIFRNHYKSDFSKLFVLLYAVHVNVTALLFIIFYATNLFYGGWLMKTWKILCCFVHFGAFLYIWSSVDDGIMRPSLQKKIENTNFEVNEQVFDWKCTPRCLYKHCEDVLALLGSWKAEGKPAFPCLLWK